LNELLGSSPEALNCPLKSKSQTCLKVLLTLPKQPRRHKVCWEVRLAAACEGEYLAVNTMLDLIEVAEQPWISYARTLELICGTAKDGQLMPHERKEPRLLGCREG
jgi:hypothetical protein